MQQQASHQRTDHPPAQAATAARQGPGHARLTQLAATLNRGAPVQRLARMSGAVVQRQVDFVPGVVTATRNAADTIMGWGPYAVTPAVINNKEIPPSRNKAGLIHPPTYDFHDSPMRAKANRFQLEVHVPIQTVSYRMELPADGPWDYTRAPLTAGGVYEYVHMHGGVMDRPSEVDSVKPATLRIESDGDLKAKIRQHELHHVHEQEDAVNEILVPWDRKLRDSKHAGDQLTGRGPLELLIAYDGVGAPKQTAQQIADKLVARIEELGDAYHESEEGRQPVITRVAIQKGATWNYRIWLRLDRV